MAEIIAFLDRHFWSLWWLVLVAILVAPMKAGALYRYVGRE